MTNDEKIGIAFCWYEPSEWEILKRTATDADTLDDTYKEWKSNANRAISEFKTRGMRINKISMKMREFKSWCEENNCVNNSEARSQYAVGKLQNRTRNQGGQIP